MPPSRPNVPRSASSSTQPPPAGSPALPPALADALARIPEPADRARFEALFAASAVAIEALGELDLSHYEQADIGTADLSVWEALAPVIRDTIFDVNKLLATVMQQIPVEKSDEAIADADLDDAFGEFEPAKPKAKQEVAPTDPRQKVKEASQIIHAIAQSLAREVTEFGEGIRKPVVMADRWNLLAHLGEFRGKFRAGIGEMVFLAVGAFAPVRKDQVVPFYREEVEQSVTLRRAVSVLAGVVRAENAKLQREDGAAACERASRIAADLETFARSAAHAAVRPGDKRSLIKIRADMSQLLGNPASSVKLIKLGVENLDKFLDSLGVINRRETLIQHDREALATTSALLESGQAALSSKDVTRARTELQGALMVAQRLYGRDPALDMLLRGAKRLDLSKITPEQVWSTLGAFKTRLAALPPPS